MGLEEKWKDRHHNELLQIIVKRRTKMKGFEMADLISNKDLGHTFLRAISVGGHN